MFQFLKKYTQSNAKEQKIDKKSLLTPIDNALTAFDNETYDENLSRIIYETGKSRNEILSIILNDDEIESCRDDIESAIKAMSFTIWGDDMDENTQNHLIKIITPHIKTFAELAVLAKFNGHAIAEYVYKENDKGQLILDKILNRIDELDNYRFLKDGNIIVNHNGNESIVNTQIKNLVLTHRATPNRPMGEMTIIKAYPSVLLRNKSWAYLGQFMVRYAQPYVVVKSGNGMELPEFAQNLANRAYQFISGGATTIDRESDIVIHQLQSDGQAFLMAEQLANRRIQKLLLGRVKVSEQTNGSRSANETDDKTRIDRIGGYLELAKEAIGHAINAMIVVNQKFGTPIINSDNPVWFEFKNEKAVDKTRAERDKLYLDTGTIVLTQDYFKDVIGLEEHHFKMIEPNNDVKNGGRGELQFAQNDNGKNNKKQELPLSLFLSDDKHNEKHNDKHDHHHNDDDEPLTDNAIKIANAKAKLIQSILNDSLDFDEFSQKLSLLNFDNDEFIKELHKQGMQALLNGIAGIHND